MKWTDCGQIHRRIFPRREDQLALWACSDRATVEATAIDVEPLLQRQ